MPGCEEVVELAASGLMVHGVPTLAQHQWASAVLFLWL